MSVLTFRSLVLVGAVLLGVGGVLFFQSWDVDRVAPPSRPSPIDQSAETKPDNEAGLSPASGDRTLRPHPEALRDTQSPDEAPEKGAASAGGERQERFVPHPHSLTRDQLQRERSLVEDAKRAARTGDVDALRRLLEEREENASSPSFSDAWEAFELIADCLEGTDLEASRRGQRFVDEQRGSTMRRDVRRYCRL